MLAAVAVAPIAARAAVSIPTVLFCAARGTAPTTDGPARFLQRDERDKLRATRLHPSQRVGGNDEMGTARMGSGESSYRGEEACHRANVRAVRGSYLADEHGAVIQAEASPPQVTCWRQRGIPGARTVSIPSEDGGIPYKCKNSAPAPGHISGGDTFSPF